MSEVRIPVRTAYSMIEALNEAQHHFDRYPKIPIGWGFQEHADAILNFSPSEESLQVLKDHADYWDLYQVMATIANALWVPRLLTPELSRHVEAICDQRPLRLCREPYARDPEEFYYATTPGAQTDLRERVIQSYSGESLTIQDPGVFRELCWEGVIDWVINRTRPNYEIRRCTWCGKWFEPLLSGRSRFCAARCRTAFNNARANTQESIARFRCRTCSESHPLDQYSGLNTNSSTDIFRSEDPLTSALAMGFLSKDEPACIACVRAHHAEWRRYISAIVPTLKEAS